MSYAVSKEGVYEMTRTTRRITGASAAVTALALALTTTLLAVPPKGKGWVSLFNGKDMTGWKVPEGDNGHWKVLDGVIDYDARSESKKGKNLVTEKEFGDYVLRIDWRLKKTTGLYGMKIIQPDGSYKKDENGKDIVEPRPNADSGIFLRGNGKSQINIWCWPAGSGEMWGYRNDKKMPAATRAGCVPLKKADKPVGEWNTFEVTVKGERVTVVLNGEKVIDNTLLPGLPAKGPITLQHHGGWRNGQYSSASSLIQFRNIYIKELK